MEYEVLATLKAKTPSGVIDLSPAQVITAPPEKAQPLIDKGKLRPYHKENPACPYLDAALHRLSAAIETLTLPEGFSFFLWAEKHNPHACRDYQAREKAQEDAYYQVGENTVSLASFRATLDAWERAALALFELYRKCNPQEPDWR